VKVTLVRLNLIFMLAGMASAAEPSFVRARVLPTAERKAAPNFVLKDASGKTVKLKKYRGKVVLLDFWATWCHGCKEEIPWFAAFQKTYGAKGLAVVGISMDEGGWNVVRPFLADTRVPYRMLLGDNATRKSYGVQDSVPDTFLIDRQGRLASAYTTGLVDKDDVDANIKSLLAADRH
jgi:cytochrome c biogenesis protein CcmG/thiol:disulfide interchange protein DsbE